MRLYENLFTVPDPSDVPEGVDYKVNLNPKSLEVLPRLLRSSRAWRRPRPAIASSSSGWAISPSIPTRAPGKPVFNRTVSLRDTWAKIEKAQK